MGISVSHTGQLSKTTWNLTPSFLQACHSEYVAMVLTIVKCIVALSDIIFMTGRKTEINRAKGINQRTKSYVLVLAFICRKDFPCQKLQSISH